MKNLIISLAILMFTVSAAHAQTIFFAATDTVHHLSMPLDSVYVRCNTNGADTTLYNNPTKLEIGGLLGVEDNRSETAYSIKLSAMNFVGGRLYVMVTSPKPDNITFLLSDLTGRTLINHTENCNQGADNFALDAPGISAGMYFLTISNGFSAKTYKILGTNSGSGDISITNIGFPITNVLAGTSDFTIIGYATGKIVTVLTATIDNYTPIGNGKDTVKFDFGDEWSKWKFKKIKIVTENINTRGTLKTSTIWSQGASSTLDTIDQVHNVDLDFSDEHNTQFCNYEKTTEADTLRFCNGDEYTGGYLRFKHAIIIFDSKYLKINQLVISYNLKGIPTDSSFGISYTKPLQFEIDSNGIIFIDGFLDKKYLSYSYSDHYRNMLGSMSIDKYINIDFIGDQDIKFTLLLLP